MAASTMLLRRSGLVFVAASPRASHRCLAQSAVKDELLVKLQSGLKDAMKSKDSFTAQVLKSALADVQNLQHNEKPTPVLTTLMSALSKRREAASVYEKQNNVDLVEQFKKEIAILDKYIPDNAKEMTSAELSHLVTKVMSDLGISKSAALGGTAAGAVAGQVLGKVVKEVKARAGLRAQNLGKELADTVKKALS